MLPRTRLARSLVLFLICGVTLPACGPQPNGIPPPLYKPNLDLLNPTTLESSPQASPLTFHNFDPVSEEAQRGLSFLYGGDILAVKGGIPVSLLHRADRLTARPGELTKLQDPNYQAARYGYPPSPPNRPEGNLEPGKTLPVALSAFSFQDSPQGNVRQIIANSCLACHVNRLGTQIVAGASNSLAYFAPLIDDMSKIRRLQTVLRLNPIWRFGTSTSEKNYLRIAIDYFDLVLQPMLSMQTTRGAITGPAAVLTYLTRMTTNMNANGMSDSLRYDTQNIMESDLALAPFQAPPVKAHPWWTVKYKPTLYRYPEDKGSSLDVMAQYFMDRHIGVSHSLSPAHLDVVKDVLRFAIETKAPAFPAQLDPDKMAAGEKIFHERPITAIGGGTCAGCHGTYHRQDGALQVQFPSRYVNVGTDSAVFESGRYFMNTVKRRVPPEELPNFGTYPQSPGYLAPPLVGIWAAAPYLHNGSVPTLYAVLKSSARPRLWARSLKPSNYDFKNGGLVVLPPGEPTIEGQIYDTTVPAYGNGGHAFVDGWDDASIYAVVEFLKSLND